MNHHKINLSLVFLIAFSFYGYFIRQPDWNVNSRLGLVKAIVEERRLVIDSYHDGEFSTEDKAYVDGHYYSDKAIGTSLLGTIAYLPVYAFIRQPLPTHLFIMLMTVLAVSIPSALLAPLLYSTALQVVKERWVALFIALCISLATPILPFAGAFYGHTLAAVMAFFIFFLWMGVHQFNVEITPFRLFLSGFLMGFMVLTEYTTFIIAIALTGYLIYVLQAKHNGWNWPSVVWFVAGGIIPLILFLSYNWICFGSPLAIGYASENLQEFRDVHSEGIMGIQWPKPETLVYMTIHPMQGLFFQSPVLLMAIGGMIVMQRERKFRSEFIVLTSVIVTYFLAISGFPIWWGGNSFTVRHLIPVLPFFGIFMMFVPRKYYPLLIALGLLSLFQMLVGTATFYSGFDSHIRDLLKQGMVFSWKTSLLYAELLPKLLRNQLSFTWGQYFFDMESWYLNLAIPVITAVILMGAFYFVNKRAEISARVTDKVATAK